MNLVASLSRSFSPLQFFTSIGPFYYLVLINFLVVFSVIFYFMANTHTTSADLEVDGSTISHISNALYKELNPSSFHNVDSLYLKYANLDHVVVEDV